MTAKSLKWTHAFGIVFAASVAAQQQGPLAQPGTR
jgi:hypothetical protein